MQIKNNELVSNGDIGYITAINTRDSVISVDFGFQVEKYELDKLDLIEHAYATSVHKSQGSEYEVVIINLMNIHKVMLWRNLLYTAVTRAKRKVIIVGQKSAIDTAIKNSTNEDCKRNTLLAVRLRYAASEAKKAIPAKK
jgi:exodeoxyribonuclease V alpha subunit